jgi:hypothetical protein
MDGPVVVEVLTSHQSGVTLVVFSFVLCEPFVPRRRTIQCSPLELGESSISFYLWTVGHLAPIHGPSATLIFS